MHKYILIHLDKNVNTIKCIEDTAKEIGRSIDNKI